MDAASQANSDTDMSLTFGMRAVGMTFNPSGNEQVHDIKCLFAESIDYLHAIRLNCGDNEVKRMLSIAITEAQTAQMWAVKAVTWGT